MIQPSQAIQEFINGLWPLAFHDRSSYKEGRLVYSWFTPDGERYPMDFSYCGNKADWYQWNSHQDWYQFDSHQDNWYYGQWCNPVTRQILTYAEGDISLIICETPDQYKAELQAMTLFEGRNGLDDHDHRHWQKLEQGKEATP